MSSLSPAVAFPRRIVVKTAVAVVDDSAVVHFGVHVSSEKERPARGGPGSRTSDRSPAGYILFNGVVLSRFDCSHNFFVCVFVSNFQIWVCFYENPEDLVCKSLSNKMNSFKVKRDVLEPIDS